MKSGKSSKKSDLKRGQHRRHQDSKKVHAILRMGPHGEPLEPQTIMGTFSNQCSCIIREHVPITYSNWKKVLENLKEKVWTNMKSHFQYPPDQYNEALCRGHALYLIGKALRNLRSKLNTQYVKKGRTPYEDYNFIKRHIWDEFVEKMTTDEAKAKGKKFSKLAKKNELVHHLGMMGYAGKRTKWWQEEREAEAAR
jgi:hypothetical protein